MESIVDASKDIFGLNISVKDAQAEQFLMDIDAPLELDQNAQSHSNFTMVTNAYASQDITLYLMENA